VLRALCCASAVPAQYRRVQRRSGKHKEIAKQGASGGAPPLASGLRGLGGPRATRRWVGYGRTTRVSIHFACFDVVILDALSIFPYVSSGPPCGGWNPARDCKKANAPLIFARFHHCVVVGIAVPAHMNGKEEG